jgi:hypothetical protein
MNARTMIVAVLLLGGAACCAHERTTRAAAERKVTVLFMGYRLDVDLDDVGTPIAAKAFDRDNKEVRTVIGSLRDVSVCPPKSLDPAAAGKSPCEPLTFVPDKTSFKSGDHSTCYYWLGGKLMSYSC